ncbi:hypothetical protein VMCG_04801 [Cytospora schulzeri]|uniref:Uncharacterized protein n=1 Tax=Cytospora schulzeri TaxID=448051 RepID=A0A423WNP2_9PEZI|nr:hypothetical protein VMCG_04801 [Valsa malicola]
MDSTFTDNSTWEVDIDVLTAAAEDEIEQSRKRPFYENIKGFRFTPKVLPPGVECLWVKYRDGEPTLQTEAFTQDYVHSELAKLDRPVKGGLYIPKVFGYAEIEMEGCNCSFIIMEFVTGTPISRITRDIRRSKDSDDQEKEDRMRPFKDRVVDALCFLLSLEPPVDAAPGPVNGGHIQSFVFGRDESYAPRVFNSLEDLHEWVNHENEKKKANPLLTTGDLLSEGLSLCYCDLNLDNFLLEDEKDPASRLTVIDFEHTSWLPYSFLVWELWNKSEGYMTDQVTSRTMVRVNRDNIEALNNIHLQRRWN